MGCKQTRQFCTLWVLCSSKNSSLAKVSYGLKKACIFHWPVHFFFPLFSTQHLMNTRERSCCILSIFGYFNSKRYVTHARSGHSPQKFAANRRRESRTKNLILITSVMTTKFSISCDERDLDQLRAQNTQSGPY